jgi:hypothetical protein
MMSKQVLTAAVVIGVLAAMPAFAQEGRQGRSRGGDRGGARAADGRAVSRAVPRAPQGRSYAAPPRTQAPPRAQAPRNAAPPPVARRYEGSRPPTSQAYRNRGVERRGYAPGSVDRRRPASGYVRPGYAVPRPPVSRGYVAPRRVAPRYVAPRYAPRGYYAPGYRGYVSPGYRYYGPGRVLAPRFIAPHIVTVLPYRPYYYRPRFSLNVFYGAGGTYPYGYTPRGFYDPLPGRIYGGVRITDAPREAQVFVDGYYAGIVDDFDGVFQHVNLEAGEHRIEVHAPGLEPIAFDVMVQPGRTITLRADIY